MLLFSRSGQCTIKVAKKYKSSCSEKRNKCRYLVSKLEGKKHVEDLGLDRRIMNIIEMERELVDWIQLTQDRHKWRVVMNTPVDPRVV